MAELNTLGSVIKSTYEGESNTNAFTDANKLSVDQLDISASGVEILSTAYAQQQGSIAIGVNADARGVFDTINTPVEGMIAIGEDSTALQVGSIAIGKDSVAGYNTGVNPGNKQGSIAIGWESSAQDRYSIAIGRKATADALNVLSIGDTAGLLGNGPKSINLGNDCMTSGERGIVIGGGTQAHAYCIAIGDAADANMATVRGTMALGREAVAHHANATALGAYSETDTSDQVRIGSTTQTTSLKVSGDVEFERNVTLKYSTWPSADGTSGQILSTNGAGTLSWADNSATLAVQDEGVAVVSADTINFVGSGVVVTDTAGVATVTIGGGGSTAWGDITGTLSTQTDLQSALDGKQATITNSDDITEGTTNLYNKIPIGGTTGQVLSKTSATNYDLQWVTSSSLTDGDKGDITVSASGATWTIDANAVTLAKVQDIVTNSFLGRATAATGDVEVLTPPQARTLLNVEDGADVTDATNVAAAGAFMTATNTSDNITEGVTNLFLTSAEQTKLSNIETGADVTDSTNVLSSLSGQALAVATINTGQGAVECYAMNQATQTTDNVTFANVTATSVIAPVVLNNQTGATYTLVLTDACKHLDLENAAATTVTVPPNASVAFDVGTRISLAQMGAGQVTIAQGAGVTIRTPETLKLRSQYSAAVLTKLATDEWLLTGDLEATV